MRPITTLSLVTLLACGPLAPPLDANTTASSATSDTDATPPTTTTIPPTTTEPTTSVAETTSQDPTTLATTIIPTTGAEDFVAKPDGASDGVDCDTFAQDCPVGQKCVPWAEGGGGSWNAAKCVEVTGDGAPGDPCFAPGGGLDGIDDCTFGAFCWDVDETLHGTCVGQCTGPPEAPICPPKASCTIFADGFVHYCYFDCDPLIQDCKGDDLCIASGDTFLCVIDDSGDMGQVNDPSRFVNMFSRIVSVRAPGRSSTNQPPAGLSGLSDLARSCKPEFDLVGGAYRRTLPDRRTPLRAFPGGRGPPAHASLRPPPKRGSRVFRPPGRIATPRAPVFSPVPVDLPG